MQRSPSWNWLAKNARTCRNIHIRSLSFVIESNYQAKHIDDMQ
jgi:hypothetical protein